jgi:predicted DNA-binding transcriptional regulator AlpA
MDVRFLTTADVCAELRVTAQTLRRMVNGGLFPEASLYPRTRAQRWRRSLVEDWCRQLERHEQRAADAVLDRAGV